MASTSNNNNNTSITSSTTSSTIHHNPPSYGSDPTFPNTTFVQADPSTFRTIVQKLTGAPDDPSTQKLPITHPFRPTSTPGPKKPTFMLHERRQSAKNLRINLNHQNCNSTMNNSTDYPDHLFQPRQRGFLVSPVSPLDFFAARVSPRSPCEELRARATPRAEEEEERAIAEKGFYLHPSPLSTPRGADPPELLPLFPLRSPRDNNQDHDKDCKSCS